MANRICAVEDCVRSARSRGWCDTHYSRWRNGRPMNAPVERNRKVKRQCTVHDCTAIQLARGWCHYHYNRNLKYGDPLLGPPRRVQFTSTEERFWSQVDRTESCWNWTGCTFWDGYGQFSIRKRQHRAHRVAYQWTFGAIPDGMLIDHRCHNPRCVNPDHLRLADRSQNNQNRRGAQSNSRSGIRGVQQLESGRWQARVRHNRQDIHVGVFDTAQDAESAAIEMRNKLFTHNDADRVGA